MECNSGNIEPGRALVPVSAVRHIGGREKVGRRQRQRDSSVENRKALYPLGGRPSYLLPEHEWLLEEMLTAVMNGESLRDICDDPRMPRRDTVHKWLARADKALVDGREDDPREQPYIRFLYRMSRARERQPEALLDDVLLIADDGRNDFVMREVSKGKFVPVVDHENINRSRLRVDARFKLAEKLAPKKYGVRPEIQINNDNRTVKQNFYAVVVQRAEALTRGLPSETLVQGGKLQEQDT